MYSRLTIYCCVHSHSYTVLLPAVNPFHPPASISWHTRTEPKHILIILGLWRDLTKVYKSARDMAPLSACGFMNIQYIHEHTWAALGCSPNRTLKSVNPEYCMHLEAHVFTVKQDRSRRGHHYGESSPSWTRGLGQDQTRASTVGVEHSSKELFVQHINSYSEHLRGVLGNKCAGHHYFKTVKIRETMSK
jgi:hypothetical protein